MDIKELAYKTDQVIEAWQQDIDNYTIEQLLRKPSADEWSLGQVYIHLWMSAKGFFFKNIQRIADKDVSVVKGGRKNVLGYLVFLFKRLPRIKIKMPQQVAVEPMAPESKELLHKRMDEVRSLVAEWAEKVSQLDSKDTTKHPLLGYLNAMEWYELCYLHFNHHLKQKKRIKKQLNL